MPYMRHGRGKYPRVKRGGSLPKAQSLGEIRQELINAGLDPNSVDAGMANYNTTGDISQAVNAGMGNGVPNIGYQGTAFTQPGYNMGMYNPSMIGGDPRFDFMNPTYDPAIPRISNRFMRRATRKEGRDLMREMRQARRRDRREERQSRRADRRENRQERRLDRREDRQQKRLGRIEARSERQQARRNRRADRLWDRQNRRAMRNW